MSIPQSPEETDVITRHDDAYNIHDHSQLVNVVRNQYPEYT